ncbi:MAG: hypothetical protein ACFFG0_04555 [Candidatus Thorarchaeota archaeon]
MKLIEALKKIKELQKKAEDLRDLVKNNCVRSSFESDKYSGQAKKVEGWIQAHSDILKEILKLRVSIQKTNIETRVDIDLGGKVISKSIAEWIHRRRDLVNEELKMWNCLTDRGIKEGIGRGPTGDPIEIKIVRFYDPSERDNKKQLYSSEPMIIDSKLEVINATTDLIE